MTEYNPPIKDMRFAIRELANIDSVLQFDAFDGVDHETIDQVLNEAGNFARDVLAPLNIPGDRAACRVENRAVQIADGFKEAYQQFVANGWQTISAPPEYDGMGLPYAVAMATFEMWQSSNMAFSLCPMLTGGAFSAIDAHGSDDLKRKYLPKLVNGEWSGTMVLTESQAGSDLAAVTTKAMPEGDHYRITGTKIFITWGDHPMAENTIHLVLARTPDAPDGIRGISMFLVPKFLVNDDGSLGERNDVYVASVEHKLGIHASPTCVMSFGDDEGAIGYLVGEENRGMASMFTMMNLARIEVGVQGLAVSDRAYQLARAYALERVQGGAPGQKGRVTIIHHPDIRRMLLVMKSQTEAMRGAAFATSALLDVIRHSPDAADREAANARMALLTPIIKGWLSETAQEVTSLGVQIHGGMGFVEETGAAQHMRDARILPIYEGTTGIQALDFVGRKILGDEGKEMKSMIADMRVTSAALGATKGCIELQTALDDAIGDLESAVSYLICNAIDDPNVPGAASVNLLMLAGTVVGGWQMARAALAVAGDEHEYDNAFCDAKLKTARFYCAQILPRAAAYARATMTDSAIVMSMSEEQF
jgi:alkylation response protein AidB-like acyl-CoA dehydrogenase